MSEQPPKKERGRIEEAIGALAMGLICLISISNVVVRYATNVSFAFTEEFSVFLLVVLTFVGSALAVSTKGHLRIGFFVERLGPTGQAICDLVSMAATTAMFAVLVYYGADVTLDEYIYEETSPGLGYPTWIYTMWLPMLSLAVIFRVLEPVIRGHKNGR